MKEEIIYSIKAPYRDDLVVKGYRFGKGDKSACIMGALRGNEIQQMYICSQIVKTLKELEKNGSISANKEILVIPCVNTHGMNIGSKFLPVCHTDINRKFPGRSYGDATERVADGIMQAIKDYSFGIQFSSFYVTGEFIPHVRMMETGYQNTSLANLFGLPYVVVRKPRPIDTTTLNFNWQNEMTAAFSIYTNKISEIDEVSAKQAVASVLRFLTRMGIIKYESHSGYISHVVNEEDMTSIDSPGAGIFRYLVKTGDEVKYNQVMAEVIDPYVGEVRCEIKASTEGVVFFSHNEPLINEGDIAFRLIRRLHL